MLEDMADESAEAFKQQGNEHFKAGRLKRASELYSKAEKSNPRNGTYSSNLSAALYELGEYPSSLDAVLRAFKSIRTTPNATPEYITKLSTRLAKALCHGARAGTIFRDTIELCKDDITQLRAAGETAVSSVKGPAVEEHSRVWREWEAIEPEVDDYAKKSDLCLGALSRLPMFCKPFDPTKTFFSIGTDDVIDLLQGWGPESRHPLRLDQMATDRLAEVAILFGGVGDGRHVLGTLSGLHTAHRNLSKNKQSKLRVHMTLLDIHDATIARDLCILMLLHQLNSEPDAIGKAEIKATLMYTFCGVVMPVYCYDRLQNMFKDLRTRLKASPPDLPPWLHVVSDAVPTVVETLDLWIKSPKSTKRMLDGHEHTSARNNPIMPSLGVIPGANADFQKTYQDRIKEEQENIRRLLLSASEEELREMKLVPQGLKGPEARAYLEANLDDYVETFQMAMSGGRLPSLEEAWYLKTKTFLPARELRKRHPGFDTAWKDLKERREIAPGTARKIVKHIETEWKPNMTLFDKEMADPVSYTDGDAYPDLKLDMFGTAGSFDDFNRRNDATGQRDSMEVVWKTCNRFFEEAAAALKALGSKIVLELVCGGLSEELAKMRLKGDLTRPPTFPRKYTRMWLSNVPDYTHGPMNMITYVLPNLQEDPQAGIACNSLANTGAWAGDEEFMYTYTLLLPEEIPRYLACKIIDPRAVMDTLVLSAHKTPRALEDLASRSELVTWLTRVLFNTFIPAQSKPRPSQVRLPHNLVAFFGIVLYLHQIGYPGHWLSDFLARVLSGSLVSDVAPYEGFYPIPVTDRARRVKLRRVRTDPWLVEFETIIATAYHAIPFPIAGALPADFTARTRADVAVWEARVEPAPLFSHSVFMDPTSPQDPRAQLLFWRTDVVGAAALIGDMQRIFEGKAAPAPGTFFVLTSQEYVHYRQCLRWRLSKKRVERMRKEKWSVVAYRNDTGQQATWPVPIQRWSLCNEYAS